MRKRWLVGTLAVLTLTLVVTMTTTMAQRPDGQKSMPLTLPPDRKEVSTQRWRTAGEPPSKVSEDATLLPALRRAEPLGGDDPMGTVDSFLQRSRKETDDSIKALTQEAEALRSRLQKVEAALARWQGVSQALNQEPKPTVANPPAPQPEAVKPPDAAPPFLPGPADPEILPLPRETSPPQIPAKPVVPPTPTTPVDPSSPPTIPPSPR